jgi:hypothetical protein
MPLDREITAQFKELLDSAENNGIVVVTSAESNTVGTSILNRPFALYELTI